MNLDSDIAEYYRLKGYRDHINNRLEVLNERIKKGTIEFTSLEGKEVTDECPAEYESEEGFKARVTVRTKTQVDMPQAIAIFDRKGIYDKYSGPTLPEWAIEQAYLAGDISDDDLRKLKKTSRSLSLKVEHNV